ncbi:MAG: hypothetical protein WBD05_10080, partial [Phycisphaerae bacterium]
MSKPWMSPEHVIVTKAALEVEQRQADEEGRDLSSVLAEFEALRAKDLDGDLAFRSETQALLETIQSLPTRPDYPYDEPSDLAGIRAGRPADGPDVSPPDLADDV